MAPGWRLVRGPGQALVLHDTRFVWLRVVDTVTAPLLINTSPWHSRHKNARSRRLHAARLRPESRVEYERSDLNATR